MASNHWVICFFRQFVSDHLKSTTPWSFMAMRWLWSFSSLGLGLMMNEIHSNLGLAPQDEVCLEVFPPKKNLARNKNHHIFFGAFSVISHPFFVSLPRLGAASVLFCCAFFPKKALEDWHLHPRKFPTVFKTGTVMPKKDKKHTPRVRLNRDFSKNPGSQGYDHLRNNTPEICWWNKSRQKFWGSFGKGH